MLFLASCFTISAKIIFHNFWLYSGARHFSDFIFPTNSWVDWPHILKPDVFTLFFILVRNVIFIRSDSVIEKLSISSWEKFFYVRVLWKIISNILNVINSSKGLIRFIYITQAIITWICFKYTHKIFINNLLNYLHIYILCLKRSLNFKYSWVNISPNDTYKI